MSEMSDTNEIAHQQSYISVDLDDVDLDAFLSQEYEQYIWLLSADNPTALSSLQEEV